jgi:hypothetical protein
MENKIPTADEFMTDEYQVIHYGTILLKPTQAAIEFAKLHVEAALKTAAKSTKFYFESNKGKVHFDVYPLTNIK